MGAKKKHAATYLESRKWFLDVYDVAAATNPAACKVRVVDARGTPVPARGQRSSCTSSSGSEQQIKTTPSPGACKGGDE